MYLCRKYWNKILKTFKNNSPQDTIHLKHNVCVFQAGGHGIDLIQNGHPHGPPLYQPAAWNSWISKDDRKCRLWKKNSLDISKEKFYEHCIVIVLYTTWEPKAIMYTKKTST